MKRIIAVLFLLGCSSPDLTGPREMPSGVQFATAPLTTDITPAATPTPVSAVVTATVDRNGTLIDSIRVTWIDNEIRADEFITCARMVGAAGEPVGTGCAYAHETQNYDQPVGTTGERSAMMVAPAGAAASATLWTARYVTIETTPGAFGTMSIHSDESAAVAVERVVTVTSTKAKGKKR